VKKSRMFYAMVILIEDAQLEMASHSFPKQPDYNSIHRIVPKAPSLIIVQWLIIAPSSKTIYPFKIYLVFRNITLPMTNFTKFVPESPKMLFRKKLVRYSMFF